MADTDEEFLNTYTNTLVSPLEFDRSQIEDDRRERMKEAEHNRRLDLVRTAKEVLLENRRMKGMDADDVTASDVVAFAKELADFVG